MDTFIQNDIESLRGFFLVSTPQMPDPRFAEQVIYICSHSAEGAIGVSINRPDLSLTLAQIMREMNLDIPTLDLPSVYIGGPVSLEAAFILYRNDFRKDAMGIEVDEQIFLTRDRLMLEAIASGNGPEDFLFILGYAGWGPGQLEAELHDNGWLIVPGDDKIIFDLPDSEKWKAAAEHYGIDIVTFNENVGYA